MSTKHVRTTGDLLRFDVGLRIDCLSCGASRTLDAFTVGKVAGSMELNALERRLKCSRCGRKEARLTKLPPPPRR